MTRIIGQACKKVGTKRPSKKTNKVSHLILLQILNNVEMVIDNTMLNEYAVKESSSNASHNRKQIFGSTNSMMMEKANHITTVIESASIEGTPWTSKNTNQLSNAPNSNPANASYFLATQALSQITLQPSTPTNAPPCLSPQISSPQTHFQGGFNGGKH